MSKKEILFEKFGHISEMSKADDIKYWQDLGLDAIFDAAWNMALDYHRFKEGSEFNESGLDRTLTVTKKK